MKKALTALFAAFTLFVGLAQPAFADPVFVVEPTDLYLELGEDPGESILNWLEGNGGAVAIDTVVVWTNDYGLHLNEIPMPVTFTATNNEGGSTSRTAFIIVQDTTAPEIVWTAGGQAYAAGGVLPLSKKAAPITLTAQANDASGAFLEYSIQAAGTITWNQNPDGSITVSKAKKDSSLTVTVLATDDYGNTSEDTFTLNFSKP